MSGSKIHAAVGIVKCLVTQKIYGVRVEENANKKWIATWAFPIKPEVAKREGYSTSQFPLDILYDKNYPGCPFCKKHEDLAAITKKQFKKKPLRICVSSPCYDDIGKILDSLKIGYNAFNSNQYDCDVLFLNCGTSDQINTSQLEQFVRNGGCLYASDQVDTIITKAFPNLFTFAGWIGETMTMAVDVVDKELKEFSGPKLNITFDLGAWALLNSAKGDVLLRSSQTNSSKYANKPVMVKVKYGKGLIFYTSFHNHAQASEKEKALLQLLLLRQLGANSDQSITNVSNDLNVNLEEIKAKFISDI